MLLAALLLAAAAPAAPDLPTAEPSLSGAAHAIEAGRLDQAKAMIGAAIGAGAKGEVVDRLLADLAFVRGEDRQALAGYLLLLARHPRDVLLLERAGIAALRLGDLDQAVALLDRATREAGVTWRGWNARGVAADRQSRWDEADAAYRQAQSLAPSRAEVANNLGWSLMLRGRWADALAQFDRAAALGPASERLTNNRELAQAGLAAGLPARGSGESDEAYATRLNDAGVVAQASGDQERARAAFAQAISLKSRWSDLAARNLESAERSR